MRRILASSWGMRLRLLQLRSRRRVQQLARPPPGAKRTKLSSLVDTTAEAELQKLPEAAIQGYYSRYVRTRGSSASGHGAYGGPAVGVATTYRRRPCSVRGFFPFSGHMEGVC